jgi:hypothetical protein
VFFVERMPLAGTNKIDLALLRQWVADGTLRPPNNHNGAKNG